MDALTAFKRFRQNVPMAKQRQFIKAWRQFRGYNQEQLAERIGVSRPHLSKIESDKRDPDLALLEAIADALRCEVADLIVRDPSSPDGLWSIYDTLTPVERVQVVEIAKTIKRTGTKG